MHEDIFLYLYPLPEGVNETVTECYGGYNVVIDPRQSQEGMKRSYRHALHHIRYDFGKDNVQLIETEAHKKTAPEGGQ